MFEDNHSNNNGHHKTQDIINTHRHCGTRHNYKNYIIFNVKKILFCT